MVFLEEIGRFQRLYMDMVLLEEIGTCRIVFLEEKICKFYSFLFLFGLGLFLFI